MPDLHPTQKSLILRLRDGGAEEDWARFQEFYWQLITGWARALGCDASVAEDIFQQTAVCLISDLPRYQPSGEPGAFRSWLKTIVKRRVYDHYRREMKHWEQNDEDAWQGAQPVAGPGAWEDQPDPDADARDVAMDRVWLHTVIDRALDAARARCGDEKWNSFRRYVLYGEDATALAAELGITKGCLFQHKSSFLDMLREEVVRLLDEFDDLPGELRQTDAARKFLRGALEDYLAVRRDLRDTAVISEPPAAVFDRVRVLREILADTPPPGPGRWLLVLPERRWQPLAPPLTIGSGNDADLRLNAPGISAHHAQLTEADNGLHLTDLGSTNGAWLNGRRVGEAAIADGDWIQLGEATLVLLATEDAEEGRTQ